MLFNPTCHVHRWASSSWVQKHLMIVVPLTLIIIFLLLYFNFRSIGESLIVILTLIAVPAIYRLWKEWRLKH